MRILIVTIVAAIFSVSVAAAQTLSGKRISRDIPVSAFDALKASGVVELKLVQGDKEGVTVEADEALQAYITIANKGKTLEIDTKKLNNKNIKGSWKLHVTVYFRSINALSVATVGHVNNEGTLKFDDLKLNISSVGNTNLKLQAEKLNMEASSVGNIELAGSAQTAVLRNSSVGNVQAADLKIGTLEVNNSGIGNMEVNAENISRFQSSMLGKLRNRGQKVK